MALFFGFYSCQEKEDALAEIKGKSMSFESFFEKVSNNENLKISDEKVLLINYEWDAQSETMSLLSSQEAEPSWGLTLEVSDRKNLSERGSKYTVYSAVKNFDEKWLTNKTI